ncbi:MAG: SH3 domain-containing protein [Anaerolineae bacterium]
MNWIKWISLLMLFLSVHPTFTQSDELAATVTIIADDVHFIRANTDAAFPLSVGAVAPFGIGDQIVTGSNGRALIGLDTSAQILLLPDSSYTIRNYAPIDPATAIFSGLLEGIAIHQFTESLSIDYQLQTNRFTLDATDGDFEVWSIEGGLNAVTTARGTVTVQFENTTQTVTANQGFALPYSPVPIALNAPLHASQVVGLAVDCNGIVRTNGSAGLRLRAGAALDYLVVDVLQDGQRVRIVGITENGLWYRIPFQTGFGWIFSSLIDADCDNLEQFPNLIGEAPEQIRSVTEFEQDLLEPFYGTYLTNFVFYR